nr:histidine kinase [Acidobacteriota bacterium]
REAFYTNLLPGSFDFQVEARNADGVWSPQPASLPFVVDPKLYQRAWFFPVLAALAGLLVFAGYRIRIRRLRYRFSLVLAERNRIARELHDTLLQGLSGITMQMQALWMRLPASPERHSLGEIIQDAGRCAREARRSLWGLRSQRREPEEFSEKLSNLAREAVSGKHLSLSLQVEDVSLSELPDAEYQLLRIAQEAIANALKHAAASCVTVRLRPRLGRLTLEIEDDGIGFSNFAVAESGHFGVEGMRERALEIGAEFSIMDASEQGTRVSVSLPLSKHFQQPASNIEVVDAHQRE